MFKKIAPMLIGVLALTGAAHAQNSIAIDFESYTLGNLATTNGTYTGGSYSDHRATASNAWWQPSNGVAEGAIVGGINGPTGTPSQVLRVDRNNSGNDGVVNCLKTPVTLGTAGEATAGPVAPSFDRFNFSFWFRTVPTTVTTGFSTTFTSWGADRTTWVGLEESGGDLSLIMSGVDSSNNFVDTMLNPSLSWGSWYQLRGQVKFNNGLVDDVFTAQLFDASGTMIGSGANTTWKYGQLANGWNGGIPVAVDGLAFNTRFSSIVGGHVYVDDIRFEAVPEPMTMAALALAGLAARRKRKAKKA